MAGITRFIGAAVLLGGLGCQTQVEAPTADEVESPSAPEVVRAERPPPPIVGGGLLITADERFAVAADIDRDTIWIVDLDRLLEHGRVVLQPGDHPNRLAADGEGRVHVALRRGGALVTLDPYTPEVIARTPVCPAPRGVAYDPLVDSLYVACLHGELLELDPTSFTEKRRVTVAPDLRDVVVDGERVLVSTFRSAQVFAVHRDGAVEPVDAAVEAHSASVDGVKLHTPRVAWRMAPVPGGGARMLHQRHRAESLPELPQPVQYYGRADGGLLGNGVVHATVAAVDRSGAAAPEERLSTALAVDLAVRPDGALAVADPTRWTEVSSEQNARFAWLAAAHVVRGHGAVAVAWRGADLVSFVREPAALRIGRPIFDARRGEPRWQDLGELTLTTGSRFDAGHALFHERTGTNIACASCHPEGGEDGHVWRFDAFGPRRTQSLRGGISQRAPFHWSGDLADFTAFMDEVFVGRMGGQSGRSADEIAALAEWLDSVPYLPLAAALDDAAQRGRAVFDRIGCADCHFADGSVDPDSHDVGTGEPLQVPSLLGVSQRLPLMHDGCAPTLAARFDPDCGGRDHGPVDRLSDAERDDLMSFLQAL